jgi:hypothetical protein
LSAHEGAVIAAESMQREDQRGLLVFGDFRGNEHRIRKGLVCIIEAMLAWLYAMVDRIHPNATLLARAGAKTSTRAGLCGPAILSQRQAEQQAQGNRKADL